MMNGLYLQVYRQNMLRNCYVILKYYIVDLIETIRYIIIHTFF
jgi:hypothetical protein